MPLPFLRDPRKQASVIVRDSKLTERHEGDDSGLEACAQDILRAINDKDYQHLALAMRAAFQILEAEPHDEEEESPEDYSYDSLNEHAASESEE